MKRPRFAGRAARIAGVIMIAVTLAAGTKIVQKVHADTVPTVSGTVSFNGVPAGHDSINNGISLQVTTQSGAKFGAGTDTSGHYSFSTNFYYNGDSYVEMQKNAPYPQEDSAATHMPNTFLLDSTAPAFHFSGSDIVRDYGFTTKTVTVTVKDDKGNPVNGRIVTVRNIGSATVTADDGTTFNAGSQQLESTGPANNSGVATLSVFPGATYQACVATGYTLYNSYCTATNFTVTDDTAVEIDYPQPPTFSGALRFNGNPITSGTATVGFTRLSAGAPYYSLYGLAHTDASSNYLYSAVYLFGNQYGPYFQYNVPQQLDDSGVTGVPNTFELTPTTQDTFNYTGQSVQHDFNFPTVKLTMNVRKADGTPASGTVSVTSVGDNQVRDSDGVVYNLANGYGQSTNYIANGVATVAIFPGVTYNACATTQQGNFCKMVNIPADRTIGVSPLPGAPANLTIPMPTNKPVLNWTAASGAAYYNVYRNGNLIDVTPNTTYQDNSITANGTYTYKINAVNADNMEGPASNTAGAIVDIAPLVQVTGPGANTTVSGTVHIGGTISAYYNYNLQLYVFNSASQAVASRYQYGLPLTATTTGYDWDTTAVPNGTYSILLSAKDAQNNKTAQSTATVKVTVQN